MVQQTFQVPDVSCGHCKQAVEGALQPLTGVDRAEVDIEGKTVTVDFEPGVISEQQVVETLEEAGYPVSS